MFSNDKIKQIIINKDVCNTIIKHCKRKYQKQYLINETREQQAYGLLGGIINDDCIEVVVSHLLQKNYRNDPSVKKEIDEKVEKYAIPAETPVDQRGWIADPSETIMALKKFNENSLSFIGAYHMHHKYSWCGKKSKDNPTYFDYILGKDTELFMFIVCMENINSPIIRAFYEGDKYNEIKIVVK